MGVIIIFSKVFSSIAIYHSQQLYSKLVGKCGKIIVGLKTEHPGCSKTAFSTFFPETLEIGGQPKQLRQLARKNTVQLRMNFYASFQFSFRETVDLISVD